MYPFFALARSLVSTTAVLAGDAWSLSRATQAPEAPVALAPNVHRLREVPAEASPIPMGAFVTLSFQGSQKAPWMGQRTYLARAKGPVPCDDLGKTEYVGNDVIWLSSRIASSRGYSGYSFRMLSMRDFAAELGESGEEQVIYRIMDDRSRKGWGTTTVTKRAVDPHNTGVLDGFLSSMSLPGVVYGGLLALPYAALTGDVPSGVAALVSGVAAGGVFGSRTARAYPPIGQAFRTSVLATTLVDIGLYYLLKGFMGLFC